ncbi:MAG TPA: hypothetical protein VGM91_01875 [Conexibacter sp.]|jgi:hypothetical protein
MSQTTTCRTCGASLAPDQRYCLSCGTRVSSPRLDFIAEMEHARGGPAANGHAPMPGAPKLNGSVDGSAPATMAATPATAAAGGNSRLDRVGGPMGAAAVVLVALGIGFLIGQSGDDNTPVAQKAPVVNIQGGLPAAAPLTTPTTATPDASATGGDTSGDASADGGADSSGDAGATSDRAARRAAADAARVEDSTRDIPKTDTSTAGGDLNRLRAQPQETATPGAPPPRDNKAPGGGSRGVTIG